MLNIYSLAYWVLILFIVFIERFRKRRSRVDSVTIFSFYFLLSYLVPAALWSTIPNIFSKSIPYQLDYNAAQQPEVFLLISSTAFLLFIFYSFFSKIKLPILIKIHPIKTDSTAVSKRVVFMSFIIIILVFIGIALSGGVSKYIISGIEARHTHSGFGLAGYFQYFYSVIPYLIAGFFIMLLGKKIEVKHSKAFLIFAFSVLLIGILSRGGRGGLLHIFILLFFLGYAVNIIKINIHTVFYAIFVLYFSLFVILNMHSISNSLITNRDFDLLKMLSDFHHKLLPGLLRTFQYFVHYLFIIAEWVKDPSQYEYPRLLSDNIYAFVMVLPGTDPSSLGFPNLPDTVNQQVMGKYNGSIPPGWLGWALLNGGYLWLVVKIIYSSFIMAVVDRLRPQLTYAYGFYWGMYLYLLIIFYTYMLLFNSTAANLIRGNIGFILFVSLLFILPFSRVLKFKLYRA